MSGLNVAAHLGWPFTPGQYVKVKPGDGWRNDWRDVVLRVSAISVRHSGGFAGFEVIAHNDELGSTEFMADDLEATTDPQAEEYVVTLDIESSYITADNTSYLTLTGVGMAYDIRPFEVSVGSLGGSRLTALPEPVEEKPLSDDARAIHGAITRHRRGG